MTFLVSVTAWGERCVPLFVGPVLDSHADALKEFAGDVRYVVHTDQPELVRRQVTAKTGREVECRPVVEVVVAKKKHRDHARLRACHIDFMRNARLGDVLVFLSADILISKECFSAIETRVAEGKKMVICCGTRTLPRSLPKRDISSAELLSWSMRNKHPITRECFYGTGTTNLPWAIYFKSGPSIVLRGFHLHPLAVVNDRALDCEKSIDWNIASCFDPEDIHIVTSKDELALAEISPSDKSWMSLGRPFNADDILSWTRKKTLEFHWWQFSHRIVIEGEDIDCGDGALIQSLMRHEERYLS